MAPARLVIGEVFQNRKLILGAPQRVHVCVLRCKISFQFSDPLFQRLGRYPCPANVGVVGIELMRCLDFAQGRCVVGVEPVINRQRQVEPRVAGIGLQGCIERLLLFPRNALAVLDFRQRRQQLYRLRSLSQRCLYRRFRLVHLLLRNQRADQPRRQLIVFRLLRGFLPVECLGLGQVARGSGPVAPRSGGAAVPRNIGWHPRIGRSR